MRWYFLALISLFLPTVTAGQVVLNEVYYDAPGSDEGFEFVELFSAGDGPLPLAGFAIEFHDGASTGWVRIWEGAPGDTIMPGRLFVVGGERVVPLPDAIDPLGLQNGPDAVRLVRDGAQLDLLGYGALEDPRFFEGNPAPDAASGSSLARRADGVDTDDNAADFEPAAPSPGRYNVARRDVALALAGTTPARDARARAGVEVFAFRVFARGLEPVEGGAVAVRMTDSSAALPPVTVSAVLAEPLPPGGSAIVELAVDLGEGYHRLLARAVYPGDERAENDTVSAVRRIGAPPLLVSEVMSHPAPGCPEYVELFNAGGTSYDLAGHWIRDASGRPAPIVSREWTAPPGGFVVLTSDAGALAGFFPSARPDVILQIEGRWPSLNHTGSAGEADSVIVLDAEFLPVDRVAYPPQPSDTRGRSLERVDLFDADGAHTWVLCAAAAGGTPGERSVNARLEPPVGERVTVSPNPFDPWGRETLVAVVPRGRETERVVVTVFDIDGRRVADLGSTRTLPSTFVWEGADAGGTRVLPGLYVLACEFFSLTNGSRRVERVVVGCGRKTDPGARR